MFGYKDQYTRKVYLQQEVETQPCSDKTRKRKVIWENMLEMIMGQPRKKKSKRKRKSGKPGDLGKNAIFIEEKR